MQAIENGEDYTHFFRSAESETMIERDARFSKPKGFDNKLRQVYNIIQSREGRFSDEEFNQYNNNSEK